MRTNDKTIDWTVGQPCVTVSGQSDGTILGVELKTTIDSFSRCAAECPQGGSEISVENVDSGSTVDIKYSGGPRPCSRSTASRPTSAWPAAAEGRLDGALRAALGLYMAPPAARASGPHASVLRDGGAVARPSLSSRRWPRTESSQNPSPRGGDFAAPAAIPLPADAMKRLKSGDLAQVKTALDDVRVSARAGSAAVPVIVDLLKQGLPPSLAQSAVETLGETNSEAGSEVLGWYAHQRNVGAAASGRRGARQDARRDRHQGAARGAVGSRPERARACRRRRSAR